MNPLILERRQVWIYLAAILGGLTLGTRRPALATVFEALLWPALAALLYATFVQVPLLHIRYAFRDGRFVAAVVGGNFVVVPATVGLAVRWLPDDAPLRLGVLLALLAPCTDWFVTFTQLGRGDTARALAVTPLNLLLQVVLLPGFLWLMLPAAESALLLRTETMLRPALALIGLPLLAAAWTERWIEARPARVAWRDRAAWWPVPLLAVVVFLIAGGQVGAVRDAGAVLLTVLPWFAAYLLFAAAAARLLTRAFHLPTAAGRTLAFSLGTRNSFVVLPLALGLPAGWETTVIVIVFQSLVELFGMLGYLRWVPGRLFPDDAGGAGPPRRRGTVRTI